MTRTEARKTRAQLTKLPAEQRPEFLAQMTPEDYFSYLEKSQTRAEKKAQRPRKEG